MHETIKNFPAQFSYEPEVEDGAALKKFKRFIIAGMGGSNLVGEVIKAWNSDIYVTIHKDYGLPRGIENPRETLVIASSYSGNTEETVDSALAALSEKMPLLIISSGGKLLELAQSEKLPRIRLPRQKIEPRFLLGLSFRATALAMGEEGALKESRGLETFLKNDRYEESGKKLAFALGDRVPIIYSSNKNAGLAYGWKIKFNETGKIPAFSNVFPELNHNEMEGFCGADPEWSKRFYFIFLKDGDDHPRITKRMEILGAIYKNKGFPVEIMELENGASIARKIFTSLYLADWASFYVAEKRKVASGEVPDIEKFKELMKKD